MLGCAAIIISHSRKAETLFKEYEGQLTDPVKLVELENKLSEIDAEYLKKEFDFGKLTNQYTFHTEKALRYLKKVGVMYDKSATGND